MSVDYYIYCPQCGEIASVGTRSTGLTVNIVCYICGYQLEREQVMSYKYDPEYRYPELYPLFQDGQCVYKETERKGYGAYCLTKRSSDSFVGLYTFDRPVTPEDIANFRELISNPDVDPERSFFARWNEETQEVEAIIGTIVNPFKEFECDANEAYWELSREIKDLVDPIFKQMKKDLES